MTLAWRKRPPLPPRGAMKRDDNGRKHSYLLFRTYKAQHDVHVTAMRTLQKINNLVEQARTYRHNGREWYDFERFCAEVSFVPGNRVEQTRRMRRMWQLLCGARPIDVYATVP
ncbi:hypothetical protein CYMTET_41517 [Cymbomonas tetramitiformis]|uniref:Uncharacterized protein n=1 Tax=Cymbomonas tetramitiformis TaxID=36881 RepID=A0AAE0F260_9CHLO|nr:hypothetical protein CYMTET_41517 [Cymbomonas tetramitiformis]